MEDFKKRVCELQNELKAPKGQYNSFGKYKYRSAEDILEAVKPLTKKYGVVLVLTDDVVQVGNRIYFKSTARLIDVESSANMQSSALAREAEDKKGMDDSQISGTATSYARKYALGALLLLDDTKDADTEDFARRTAVKYASAEEKNVLRDTAKSLGVDMKWLLEQVGAKVGGKMTAEQLGRANIILRDYCNAN